MTHTAALFVDNWTKERDKMNKIVNIDDITPINDRVLVIDLEFGEKKTIGGLILRDDDGKSEGIHSRWAKVIKVGADQKDLVVGDYVLMSHGRWTRAVNIMINDEVTKMFMIDYPDGLLAISKSKPKELERVGK